MTRLTSQNTTGISYKVTKEPQCRHSVSQGFVTYTIQSSLDTTYVYASCSNCDSSGDEVMAKTATMDLLLLKEQARNELMKVEAPPLVTA